jgi:hypothetical protein
VADTIKLKSRMTLKFQANLGEEVDSLDFEAGTEFEVLQEFDTAWLAKTDDGKLVTVLKDLADPS